ncbi:TPA: hypothetical protein NIB79_005227 [Pseudomonas aeruginosa]|nr:hypothetical protein [Pseudomonas aeruginosa]
MSLESTVSELVVASNSLTKAVSSKITEIDSKVAAATSAVPLAIQQGMYGNLYVDSVGGNDSNNGKTWATAKKTIKSAVDSTPIGSVINCFLKAGMVHYLESDIYCPGRVVQVHAEGYVFGDPSTYVELRSIPYIAQDGVLVAGGFQVGPNGFISFAGVKLSTARFGAEHNGKLHDIWRTSFIKTGSAHGVVRLMGCSMDIINASFMYQHTAGSIGKADLLMRNVVVNKASLVGQPVTTGHQYLMGTLGNYPMPFSLYGIEMVRQGAANWGELVKADMTNASTNLTLT